MTDPSTLLRRWEQLAAERVSFEATWQDIADHLLGRRDILAARVTGAGGARRDARLYDGTSM